MDIRYPSKRSRSGCWTCRNRYVPVNGLFNLPHANTPTDSKKKCDGESFPCKSCVRLALVCDRGTKLVWEDDERRKGMQRRGPRKTFPTTPPGSRSEFICSTKQSQSRNLDHAKPDTPIHTASNGDINTPIAHFDLCLSKGLTTHESFLLDHYIQRFSRIYPTFSGPTNPFLSILLPLAIQDQTVMSAVLALSGAQFEANRDAGIARATLQARHRALEGCRKLVVSSRSLMDPNHTNSGKYPPSDISSNNLLFILACCICLLLYEKLVGDGKANWMPHLSFLAGLFDQLEIPKNAKILESIRRGDQQRQAFDFIHHLFLYNDLLQSTAQRKSTLSRFYLSPVTVSDQTVSESSNIEGMLQLPVTQWQDSIKYGRFYYPYLVAQISAGEETISDSCIDNWDGRLDWLPSFSLLGVRLSSKPVSSVGNYWISANNDKNGNQIDRRHESIMISIYRNTAKIYLRQCLRRWRGSEMMSQCGLETVDLACHATFLISQLPDGSSFENALLWPIGIIGPELTAEKDSEREYLLNRLRALEHRFQMKHFERVREVLSRGWNRAPPVNPMDADDNFNKNFDDDVFLFG